MCPLSEPGRPLHARRMSRHGHLIRLVRSPNRSVLGRQHWDCWWRRLLIGTAAVCTVAVVTITALTWYAANRLMDVGPAPHSYPLRVVGVGQVTIVLAHGPNAEEPGSFRLTWRGGQARIGPVLVADGATVTRPLSDVSGTLTVGKRVALEPNPFTGDPRRALGLAFTDVIVPGLTGPLPAWQLQGTRRTWVILIHGLRGSRADTLPAMPTLSALGFPMLAVTYRNDPAAAPSADHRSHLGDTEWHDVEAAVRYALARGASGVVLYGWSLGGGMATVTSEQSPLRGAVRALVLDSPLLDWPATLTSAARRQSLPPPLWWAEEQLLAAHLGSALDRYDSVRLAAGLSTPTLLIQGSADTIVPPSTADAFARARPEVVSYMRISGADHASAVDVAPDRYAAALRHRLDGLS